MMADTQRPTLSERYGSSVESSNLRIEANKRSDADLLIAAGWLEDRLGALLFRLAHEFDGAKGDHGIAKIEFERIEQLARTVEKQSAAPTPDGDHAAHWALFERRRFADLAEEIRAGARAQAATSMALIMTKLKTLRETKGALVEFAWRQARRHYICWPEHVMASIVGQVLDIHLDATCPHCQGRGFNGGFGVPRIACKPCKEAGMRDKEQIGKDAEQREFGGYLLMEMRRVLALSAAAMKRATMGEDEATEAGRAAAQAAMLERLRAARSVEAAKD